MLFHKIKRIDIDVRNTAIYMLTNGDYIIQIDGEYKIFYRDEQLKHKRVNLQPCFDSGTGFIVGFVET